MATSIFLQSFFLLCLLHFSVSSASNDDLPKTGFVTLPVKKDPITHQYITSIGVGTPKHKTNLAIDLSGKFLWYTCYNNSSSYKPECTTKNNTTCGSTLPITNPFSHNIFNGHKGEDLLHFPQANVPHSFVSVCANSARSKSTTTLLTGLAKGTKGILGLARSKLSLPFQISSSYNIPPKFTLCLPSSSKGTGKLLIGGRQDGGFDPTIGFAKSSSSGEYFINVKSITISNKDVNFNTSLLSLDGNGNGGTRISTLSTPFTMLHHSIFVPFVRDFVDKTEALKLGIKRVKPVAPFGACFDANTVRNSDVGPIVPDINLVLDGGVKCEMFGHNSMVKVNDRVVCLAFVDGGKHAKNAIVLGGRQLEDKILEFDLSNSTLSIGFSLLLVGQTCSDPILI